MSKKFHLKLVTINNSILSDKKNYMFMGKWCEVGIKNKSKIRPVGFVLGIKNIYLSTSNGKLLIIGLCIYIAVQVS